MLRKSVRNWQGFEQGLEALMRSAAPIETRSLYDNKSLCLNDILIKARVLCLSVNYKPWSH